MLCVCLLSGAAPARAQAPAATPTPSGFTSYGAGRARLDLPIGPQPGALRDEPQVRRGIYDRPYLMRLGSISNDVAIGGYLDLAGSYLQRDGVSDGFSAEARRFNIFLTSRIADFLRLSSELEFEHGAEEISLEFAALDVLLHHTLNLRAGVLLVPIGKFNIAHDSPLYDVVDRPLVSTRIIPATFSDVGGGLFGTFYPGGHKLTYEAYVINGLQSGVIAAEGTRLAAGKGAGRFEKDNNGQPAVTARVGYATPPRRWFNLEMAGSFYSGAYNQFQGDGLVFDDPRWLHIAAYDAEASVGPVTVRGELAYAWIDLPPALTALHGGNQFGFYGEIIGTFFKRSLLMFQRAALLGVLRVDYVDLNRGRRADGTAIGDETWRLTAGLSFRPVPATSLRVAYLHEWVTDLLGNPGRAGGVQLGIATYF
jgi:hypothetical protein